MNPLKTFFYSLKNSLIKPKYYRDVADASFGFSFKYLWFLFLLLTFIKVLSFGGQYLANRARIQPEVNKLMIYTGNLYPADLKLQIKNGQLSTNVREPYIFDIGKDESNHFITIDTKGSIDNYPSYNTNILATRNAVVYPSESRSGRAGETSVFYFNQLKKDFTLDKKVYDNLLNIIKPYAPKVSFFVDWLVLAFSPMFMFFGSFFWTIGTMFGLLFLTFFIWLVNLIFKRGFGFGSLYKMGMHAVTLPLIISEVAKYLKQPIPNPYTYIYFLWMLVVLFSLDKKNKEL
ncbi:MAG: DUF1189 family protein [Patescibacteria group bacterium]|jgi:hypothetical protein